MMKIKLYLLISVALSAPLAGGTTNPFDGTWKLNVQKSKYAPGTCPKRMTIWMETVGDGVHYRSETTYANGRSSSSQYTADYSGPEAIVRGAAGLMAPVSLKRIDSRRVLASYVRAFGVVATSRRVVSVNGRVMTITTTSRDHDGKVVTNVGVYDRSTGR
jgi:hypothetical protein